MPDVYDQSEQQVFGSHVVVVEPLGLFTRKRQNLLGTWSKTIHCCVWRCRVRCSAWLKLDTAPALQTFTIKAVKSTGWHPKTSLCCGSEPLLDSKAVPF
jgi:hypothetical protein